MSAEEILRLMSHFTLAQVIERDMFQERLRKNREIRLHELPYQILQGYDSVMIRSDLTVIGSDQIHNELQARVLQKYFGQEPQDILALELLVGIDGKEKMSQSLGNDIGLEEPAPEIYGKVMSLPDQIMPHYFMLLTDVPQAEIDHLAAEIGKKTPVLKNYKKKLARLICEEIWGAPAAKEAEENFTALFERAELPAAIKEIRVRKDARFNPLVFLVENDLAVSKSEAKRLIQGRAVEINNQPMNDWRKPLVFEKDSQVRVGKKGFLRVRVKD